MKQYDSYKDSGIEWIGKIPSHWKVMPLKRYGQFNKGLSFTKADLVDNGCPVVSYGQVHSKLNKGTHLGSELIRYVPEQIANSYSAAVHKGDFIFADTSEDIEGSGNVVYNDTESIIYGGYHTVLYQTRNDDNKFLAYLFNTDCWRSQIRSRVSGVKVYSITQYIFGLSSLILPPSSEQQAIASFLDAQTARIDSIIASREKKIKLLEELRASIISQAITKGIRKDVEMKDSGIEWIGQIPKHWEVSVFKRFLKEPMKYGANESAEFDNPNWPRYIRITDIDEMGSLKKETFKSLPPEKAKEYLLEKGDVLFARSGATVGKTYIHRGEIKACYAGYLIKGKCKTSLLPEFLFLYTQTNAYDNWKNSVFIQATIQNIGADKYSVMPIVVPPIEEQKIIVEYSEDKISHINANIDKTRCEISLLKEYRASLITEVVTGKRKVTN